MNEFLTQLAHPQTFWPLVIVLAAGLISWVSRAVVWHNVRKGILQNDASFVAALDEAEAKGPKASPSARLLADVVSLLDEALPAGPAQAKRWLVGGPVSDAYATACERAAAGRFFVTRLFNGIGESLTGIALVFTFVLIAWVLATEVPRAIGGVTLGSDAGTAKVSNEALQSAIALIGAKFTVSALGLLLSLIFRAIESGTTSSLVGLAHDSVHRHRALFVSDDRYRSELLLNEVARSREQAEQSTLRLERELRGLTSIEVSVKEMGQEVSTHLGTVMKNQIADQICKALDDIREFAAEAMERAQSERGADQKALLGAVGRLQETLANQSKSDVERLIERLHDTVGQGYDNEAKKMASAMAALSNVLPALEGQMRRMTDDVDRQMRERAESNGRAQAELFGELRTMLADNRSQMAGMVEMNQKLLALSEDTVTRLVGRSTALTDDLQQKMVASGQAALAALAAASSGTVGKVQSQMSEMTQLTATTIERFTREVDTAQRAFAGAREAMVDAVTSLAGMTKALQSELARTAESGRHANEAVDRFRSGAALMSDAGTRIDRAITSLGERLEFEQALSAQQRELLETIMPSVIDRYSKAVETQAAHLNHGWTQLADNVGRTVTHASEQLAESVEDLTDQVKAIQGTLAKFEASVGGRR